jgi:hypothetical protein
VRRISTVCFAAVLASGGAVALTASPAAAAVTTVKCVDQTDPHAPPGGTWTVKYTTANTYFGPAVTVTFLGHSSQTGEFSDPGWKLTWVWADRTANGEAHRGPDTPVTGNAAIKAQAVLSMHMPRVTSPDGRCTIYLVPYTLAPSTGQKAVWMGDSLVDRSAGTLVERQAHAATWNSNGWKLEHDGLGGATWAARRDSLRGLRWTAPKRVAISLGGNDAIWLMFLANGETTVGQVSAEQAAISQSIHDAVTELKATGRCVILTTPPAPSNLSTDPNWAAAYQLFSTWIGNLLKAEVTSGKVAVFDWAEVSGAHHYPDSQNHDGDWYEDDDQLHPNEVGTQEFVDRTLAATNTGC